MRRLMGLALYTLGVVLFCTIILPKTALALDDIVLEEKTREELLAEDRALELEWLKEDYKKMGYVIDE